MHYAHYLHGYRMEESQGRDDYYKEVSGQFRNVTFLPK
jgi:hypothetical protein